MAAIWRSIRVFAEPGAPGVSYAACAEIVRRADPDRFLATMAAPVDKRGALFAVFAFNVEINRAARASSEPLVCEMRLQFWRDTLDEVEAGVADGGHEIIAPLAEVVDAGSIDVLRQIITARSWDAYGAQGESEASLGDYLNDTDGGLMWVAAKAVGITEGETAIREVGYGSGLANWFRAVPELERRGRRQYKDTGAANYSALATDGLKRLRNARRLVPRDARYVTKTGWQADSTLRTVAANPATVAGGLLHKSEFSRRSSLLWRVMLNRP